VPSTGPQPPIPIDDVRLHFEAEGLALLAVTDAVPLPEEETRYERWLDEGRAGSMDYMHRHRYAKYRPDSVLDGARSIILVGLNYFQQLPRPGKPDPAAGDTTGRVARYAWGRDYHKALGKPLKRIARALEVAYPGHRCRGFTDATPLSERAYGERAGLGFRGRNTLLIHPALGSWFFIGEIVTTLPLTPTSPAPGARTSCPTHCRRCIEACPTAALRGPYDFDARRCISYLTIEHGGQLDEELAERMGDWVFGCDRCQEVCPLNAGARETGVADFRKHIAGPAPGLAELLTLRDDDAVRRRYAGSPLLRARRRGLVRNACIAAANAGARELREAVAALTGDADEVVAETARWARDRLSGDAR
jgi:epoxyqueuosine reductase